MARPPDGARSRESTMSFRIDEDDRKRIRAIRATTGATSNSHLIRRLLLDEERRLQQGGQKSA